MNPESQIRLGCQDGPSLGLARRAKSAAYDMLCSRLRRASAGRPTVLFRRHTIWQTPRLSRAVTESTKGEARSLPPVSVTSDLSLSSSSLSHNQALASPGQSDRVLSDGRTLLITGVIPVIPTPCTGSSKCAASWRRFAVYCERRGVLDDFSDGVTTFRKQIRPPLHPTFLMAMILSRSIQRRA